MVPPGDIGAAPIWVGVYLALGLSLIVSSYLFYHRVFRLVLQGKSIGRFDQPLQRLKGALIIVLGQRRVLQRVPARDWAGVGHATIFWGFLSFALSYVIFIFVGSVWGAFPEKLLTTDGVRVYSRYLDIMAAVLLVMLIWAVLRRWAVKPHRLSFDLTRNIDSVIVVGLIAALMLSTLLTHSFYVAQGGHGAEADVFIGNALGDWFGELGLGTGAANTLQGIFWWIHLAIILGFSIYIPFSKHMHMVAAPLNAYFRSLEPGALWRPSTWKIPSDSAPVGSRISLGNNCWMATPVPCAAAVPTCARPAGPGRSCPPCTLWRI